jgi:hypothetical protein
MGTNARVSNSSLNVVNEIGNGAFIKDSNVELMSAGNDLKIVSSVLGSITGISLNVGNNFELFNSHIIFLNMRYRNEDIPNNVSFKNTKATFILTWNEYDLAVIGTLGVLSNGAIKFPEGFKVDFHGKRVCQNGSEDQFETGRSLIKIKTQEDLVRYCK